MEDNTATPKMHGSPKPEICEHLGVNDYWYDTQRKGEKERSSDRVKVWESEWARVDSLISWQELRSRTLFRTLRFLFLSLIHVRWESPKELLAMSLSMSTSEPSAAFSIKVTYVEYTQFDVLRWRCFSRTLTHPSPYPPLMLLSRCYSQHQNTIKTCRKAIRAATLTDVTFIADGFFLRLYPTSTPPHIASK